MKHFTLNDAAATQAHFDDCGRLMAIHGPESEWILPAPDWLWSLRGKWSDKEPQRLLPQRASAVTFTTNSLEIRFSHLIDEDSGEIIDCDATFSWILSDGRLSGAIHSLVLPEDLQPAAFAFPDAPIAYGDHSTWHIPSDIGVAISDAPGHFLDAKNARGYFRQRLLMQFTAWCENGTGVYLDSRDSDGWMKSLLLRGGGGVARVCIEHLLPVTGDSPLQLPPYPASLATFRGDWYEAARLYRPWALQQQWASRGPEQRRGNYFAEVACWLWNRGRIANVVPATKELARRLELPVALDWYWWHKHAYDTNYPDYFPPREGEEAFRAAVRELQAEDIAVQVYTNGMSWDKDEPNWESEGKDCTLMFADGSYHGVVYNTWMNRKLMHTCGGSAGWRKKEGEVIDQAAALGLDGLYIDQIATGGANIPCFSDRHGHTPGPGTYSVAGFRSIFAEARKRHPHLALSSESAAEVYQDLLDGCITLQPSWERSRTKAQCDFMDPIPMFLAVYHGYAVLFGNYAHIDGRTPYDELWPEEGRTPAENEKDWKALCPDQFALALTRTLTFGCQPLATNVTMEQLDDPRLAEDITYLIDLSRFYHAHREWLLWGEMLAPAEVDCETIAVQCVKRGIFTDPATIEPYAVERPAVLHSTWRSPAGEVGMVLANYSRQEQSLSFRRRDNLVPDEGANTCIMPPRSLRFIPLHAD